MCQATSVRFTSLRLGTIKSLGIYTEIIELHPTPPFLVMIPTEFRKIRVDYRED